MKNVLVVTMPNTRNYTIHSDLKGNDTVRTFHSLIYSSPRSKWNGIFLLNIPVSLQMNDYMAAYHDSVLLIGQVMRDLVQKPIAETQLMEYVNVNYFRNTTFNGRRGGRSVPI